MSDTQNNSQAKPGKTRLILFIAAIAVVFGALLYALEGGTKTENQIMVGEPLPPFSLPSLDNEQLILSNADISEHGYKLLNVWASWCAACKSEHAFLMGLKQSGIEIIGLNYRDKRKPALAMLDELGSPYSMIVHDLHGSLALDLGVIGAPETFLIDPQGSIVHRFSGVLDSQVWQTQFTVRMQEGN